MEDRAHSQDSTPSETLQVEAKGSITNLAGRSSGFVGDLMVQVGQGWFQVTGRRGTRAMSGAYAGAAVTVGIGSMCVAVGIVLVATRFADSASLPAFFFGIGTLLLLAGVTTVVLVSRWVRRTAPVETANCLLHTVRGRRVKYDWDIGCLLMLLLTIPVGFVITLVRGRRFVRLRVPIGPGGAMRGFVFRTKTPAEGLSLQQVFAGRRAAGS